MQAVEDFGAVGLIGHEEGATVAALVAARAALGEGPPLRFAVVCGGVLPTSGPYAELLQQVRETPDTTIPKLHCIGRDDPYASAEDALELAACFDGAEILWCATPPDRHTPPPVRSTPKMAQTSRSPSVPRASPQAPERWGDAWGELVGRNEWLP